MIDDHDRCEWVNVSSGTGSPRLSRTNPESCKTAVCVINRFAIFTYTVTENQQAVVNTVECVLFH